MKKNSQNKNKWYTKLNPQLEKKQKISWLIILKKIIGLQNLKLQIILKKNFQNLQVQNIVFVSNGTLTMSAVLECLNIRNQDEVLVSNYTMVATANVVKFVRAKVKLVDISDKDLCMCPIDLQKKINN